MALYLLGEPMITFHQMGKYYGAPQRVNMLNVCEVPASRAAAG
jgi:hypothetical protein